eukprot:gene1504-1896_t
MYIQDIVIEGFKSYANRTVIEGFDPTFNAITGLNGSGKSNILDAICFVLGISTLSQVRVSNLQELVYKQGQAGVTKASVTITFDNSNRDASPVGYEHCDKITVTRQVAIGNRNKYLINGHNAQQNRVLNLFHSVQLNINNPHFLIMQGRITKVLNMKPPEILAMIEEAAGTRMYEMKRQSALSTMEKKQKKVDEITRVLDEEITPTLEKLRKERSEYMQWTNNHQVVERLNRYVIAFEFTMCEKTVQNKATGLAELEESLESKQQRKEELAKLTQEYQQRIEKLTAQREKESDSQLSKLEERVEELSKLVVKHTSTSKHQKELLEKELLATKSLSSNQTELRTAITQKQLEKSTLEKKIEGMVNENTQMNQNLKNLQNKLQAMTAGITEGGDTENGSFTEQLMEAKREAVNAATEWKQAEIRIKHLNSELAAKKKMVTQEASDHKKMHAEYGQVQQEMNKLKEQIKALEQNHSQEQDLSNRKRELEPIVSQLREKVGYMSAQVSGMEFTYTDPSRDFDRSKVKGIVANLISLLDGDTATALEVCAGGKLYNIVIEDTNTGKALLSKGNLKRRVTFLPLDQIDNRTLDQYKLKNAEKVSGGKGNVKLALDCIEYDKSIQNAMNYVFGTTLIAKEKKYAQLVAFDKNIKTKTISLEGDEYNPMGSLTGGSRPANGSILSHIQKLNEANSQLKQNQSELEKVNFQLASLKSQSDQYKSLQQQSQIKEHEFNLIHSRLKLNPHHQLLETIKEIEANIESDTRLISESKKKEQEQSKKARELEDQSNNFQSRRDAQIKDIEKNITLLKEQCTKSNKIVKTEQQVIEKIALEIQELESELESISEQSVGNEGQISLMEKKCKELDDLCMSTKEEYESTKQTLHERKTIIQNQSESIRGIKSELDKSKQESLDTEIEIKKIDHKIQRYHKDQADAARLLETYLKKHTWIKTDRQYFGKLHGDYDFTSQDPQAAHKKLKELVEQQDTLSKTINKKVLSMFDKAEQEYNDLVEKKTIIENDKLKIEAVIEELDEKKNESLRATWIKVNKDFGSIFSTLLPGATAKLEPPEGKTELDGLEVKVAFGGVWKETLSELSGGQKSLLALSLILSLLLFKPAPMYILDEIDAALDLSHTQNIGMMLKQHFTSSQFIVVSLKEGMFNNANVLFETKFVDGVSKVIRNQSHGKGRGNKK